MPPRSALTGKCLLLSFLLQLPTFLLARMGARFLPMRPIKRHPKAPYFVVMQRRQDSPDISRLGGAIARRRPMKTARANAVRALESSCAACVISLGARGR